MSSVPPSLVNGHGRQRSITGISLNSVSSQPHSYHGTMSSAGHAAYSHQRSPTMEEQSDDNVSQTTMDSIPRSVSSAWGVRGNNNGLDLVMGTTQSGAFDPSLLPPSVLVKKPSKRKKLLNMFKKSPKPKAS